MPLPASGEADYDGHPIGATIHGAVLDHPFRSPAFEPATAPRLLSWQSRLRLVIARPVVHFGWFFAAFGMVFVALFAPDADLTFGYDRTEPGRVLEVSETNSAEDDETVYAVRYAFETGGDSREGTSYTTSPPAVDEAVVVEVDDDASQSRIVGMRARPFGALVLIVLLFPIVGVGMAISGMRHGWRDGALLTRSRCATAIVTGTRVSKDSDGDDVHHASLAFEHRKGKTQREIRRGQRQDLAVGDAVPLLYDPLSPTTFRLSRDLPGRPHIDATGALRFEPGAVLLHLATPVLAIATSVASWLLLA